MNKIRQYHIIYNVAIPKRRDHAGREELASLKWGAALAFDEAVPH